MALVYTGTTLGLESLQDLNFRLGNQTKVKFWTIAYHRGLSTLAKYHREATGLQIFFHHSDKLSCITFYTK